MTFTIAARCPRTGMLGVATASKALAAGAAVPYVRAGVGAIASQSFGNPFLGFDGLKLLAEGASPQDVLSRLLPDDPGRDLRQVLVVDARGRTAAHTGATCIAWAGHREGEGYVVGGNLLARERVIEAMAQAFEESEHEELPERLLRALEAGQDAGGDRRGKQSAGVLVLDRDEHPYIDLRVDDHAEPVAELRRILELKMAERRAAGGFRLTRETLLPPGALDRFAQVKAAMEKEPEVAKEQR